MDYAADLLVPIGLALWAGWWLTNRFGASPLWMVLFVVLGMVMGIAIMARRQSAQLSQPSNEDDTADGKDSHSRP